MNPFNPRSAHCRHAGLQEASERRYCTTYYRLRPHMKRIDAIERLSRVLIQRAREFNTRAICIPYNEAVRLGYIGDPMSTLVYKP